MKHLSCRESCSTKDCMHKNGKEILEILDSEMYLRNDFSGGLHSMNTLQLQEITIRSTHCS